MYKKNILSGSVLVCIAYQVALYILRRFQETLVNHKTLFTWEHNSILSRWNYTFNKDYVRYKKEQVKHTSIISILLISKHFITITPHIFFFSLLTDVTKSLHFSLINTITVQMLYLERKKNRKHLLTHTCNSYRHMHYTGRTAVFTAKSIS